MTSSTSVTHVYGTCDIDVPHRLDVRIWILSILEFGKSARIPKVLEFQGIPMEYLDALVEYLGMAHL